MDIEEEIKQLATIIDDKVSKGINPFQDIAKYNYLRSKQEMIIRRDKRDTRIRKEGLHLK